MTITVTKGYNDPTGWTSGETVTPAKLNSAQTPTVAISDIVNADIGSSAAIAHSKLASITAGQVLLGNASNVPTATALSGDVTVTSSGVTAIGSSKVVTAMVNNAAITQAKLASGVAGTGPAFRAHTDSLQTISNATSTKVVLGVEQFDTDNCFVAGAGATESRFTPTVAGYYWISGAIYGLGSVSGGISLLLAEIWKNGAVHSSGNYANVKTYRSNVSDLVYLNGTTDYVELYAYHSDGAARAIGSSGSAVNAVYLSGSLVRAA